MYRNLSFFVLTSVFLLTSEFSFGQFPGCPSVDAGADQTLNCSTPCATLTAVPFNAGATTSYSVAGITHSTPIAYDEPGGTPVSLNIDDVWSPQINLPFTFCYYGQNYSTCKIGSNGAIKFGTFPETYHPWSFSQTCPSTGLKSAGDIFGIYHDIDPSVCGNIKWYIIGTAPCRIFVVSFNNICQFLSSCNSLKSRHMMVLYETTNVIDVYVESKPTCSSWNSGNAVIGIQNPAGTAGVTPPSRNTGAWSVNTPEAWRFLPNGAPIYTLEWFEGTTSLGTTASLNVCPTVPTTYTAVATYTACNGAIIVEEDDVVVSPSSGGIVVSEDVNTPASCGLSNGSVTVSASGGTMGYTYSIDNVTYQGSGIFSNLSTGSYSIYAKDGSGCVGVIQIEIIENTTLELGFSSVQQVSCFEANDGQATLVALNGQSPYQFSLNGGAPGSSSTFSNLSPGLNTFTVIDNSGCSITIDSLIIEPTELLLNLTLATDATCGANDGQIEVSATGGILAYSYQLDGASTQSTGIFSGIGSGTYIASVIDGNGCEATLNVTINSPSSPILILVNSDPVCTGQTNSNLVVSATGGVAPYTYDVNGSNPQSSPIFTTLGPGSYTINVTDNDGCTTPLNVEVEAFPLPQIFNDTSVCDYNFQVLGTESIPGGIWSSQDPEISFLNPSDTSIADPTLLNPLIIPPFIGQTYVVSFTDDCNQTVSASINFRKKTYTQVLDTTICLGSSYTIFAQENITTTSFSWSTGELGSSITVTQPGNYVVTADGVCGVAIDTAIIQGKICDIIAPNVIVLSSKDGNEAFFVQYSGVKEFECAILNRWGNLMYEYFDAAGKWDGTSNGKIVDEGTYYYILRAVLDSGEQIKKHGFVQVKH
jgi:hypothetical protein